LHIHQNHIELVMTNHLESVFTIFRNERFIS
jgi:hypothetical protein